MMTDTPKRRGRPPIAGERVTLSVAVSRQTYDRMTALMERKGYIQRSFIERAITAELDREERKQ